MANDEQAELDRASARHFDASRTALAVLGLDGAIRRGNAAWRALLGAATDLRDRVDPGDRGALEGALGRVRDGGHVTLRLRLVPGDAAIACELTAEPGGACVYCEARPVDEAPDAATRAALLRALDATTALGLYMISPDGAEGGKVLYANAAVEQTTGFENLSARARAGNLTRAEVQRRTAGLVDRSASGAAQGTAKHESLAQLSDGRTVSWLEVPVADERGGALGRLFVSRDVTERKLTERAMAEAHARQERSEAEFRRLLEHVPDGIVVMREGKFAYANPAAARILGYDSSDDLIGIHFASIVRPEELSESDERVRLMGGAAPPPRRLRPMVRRDGSTVYAETHGFPIELDGAPATLVIAHDVTEELRLETQMRRAERLASLGTLSAAIAHEINNPLTYILLNLRVIRRWIAEVSDEAPSPRLADALRLVDQSLEGAERVRVIVSDLRDFSRSGDEGTSLVDVRAVLDSVVPMAEHELRGRAALVRDYDDSPPAPRVRANAAVLGTVFLNMLVNAAQAIDEDGRVDHEVRVGVGTASGCVVVTIRDTGRGMTREVRERIFEPFFTTKPAGEGTGLGLSLCLRRVHALGGEIAVASEPGGGSTFTVSIPVGAAEPEERAAPPEPVVLPRARVLVVDDEPRIAERLAELLGAHEVVIASSGREALARMAEAPFDVVFCDLMMPGMKGTEVYDAACREQPELCGRFVFMTAGAFTPGARALLDHDGSPRLDKPFTDAEVQQVLALVLTRAGVR